MTNKPITPEEMKAYVNATWKKCQTEAWQEPVAWMTFNAAGEEDDIWYEHPEGKLLEGWTYKPLYTTPRRWQGLTDDEKQSMVEWAHPDIIDAIEFKLRERNT